VGDYLLSKKSLIQNFGPLDCRPGPVKVGQEKKNTTSFRAPPRRTLTQIKKLFLIEPRRLAASVEGLKNSLAIVSCELQAKKQAPIYWRAVDKGLKHKCVLIL